MTPIDPALKEKWEKEAHERYPLQDCPTPTELMRNAVKQADAFAFKERSAYLAAREAAHRESEELREEKWQAMCKMIGLYPKIKDWSERIETLEGLLREIELTTIDSALSDTEAIQRIQQLQDQARAAALSEPKTTEP